MLRKTVSHFFIYLALAATSVIMVIPLVWMFSSSLKTLDQIFSFPPSFIADNPTFDNFIELFVKYNFYVPFINSTYIALLYTAGAVFFCALAGYAFSKYSFRGQEILFLIVLGSMMIPFETTMVPLFQVFKKIGWINRHVGLIVPGLANAFGIFFMKQYIGGISNEIIESGRIDGCGEFGIFLRLIAPILKPAFASLGIIFFMNSWNNYLWPVVVLKTSEKFTLSVALKSFEQGMRTPYHLIMAGSVVSVTPLILVFLALQKQFISGITAGSVKG